jgi:urate oxidase
MPHLGKNRWGKTDVRISKIHRTDSGDDFSDLSVQVLLEGDVEVAHTMGDNKGVLPTDTMKNTVYGLAQEHLAQDLEGFAAVLSDHFLTREGVTGATVSISQRLWARAGPTGFIGGGSERRTARVARGTSGAGRDRTWAGIDGLVVLKTSGSAFSGFPRDEFTTLPETDDRILATSVTATWRYSTVPDDTTATWERAREALLERFFDVWSASVQHQGWLMAVGLLEAIPAIDEVEFHLPNQHHLAFDLARFGMEYQGTVFQPVSEPYGDIGFIVTR